MSISRKTLEHPVLVLIVFTLLGVLGIFTSGKLAMALFPETDNPYLMVMTTYTNAGPESVEKTITQPIENALVSINGLKEITSTSSEGSSMVALEFNYGTDLDAAVSDVRDKLDRVKRSLPDNADSPSIMRFSSSSMPIMRILVSGNRSVDDIKKIAEDQITDVLEQADGVGEATVNGGRTAQVNVELSQNRLESYNLTVTQVVAALAKQNLELGGGKLNEGTRDYVVRTTGEYTSIDEINSTVITTKNGYDVKLSDVGNAYMGYGDQTREAYINGEPGVYVSITKQSDANSVSVADNVYKKIDELEKILPSDISLKIISDDTTSIRETIDTLISSCIEGLLLAVLVLFVFLQNFKSTIIIAISIPLSMIITLFAMSITGITLNMMTLTGLILGVGMVVDASIVMIDNIYSYRQRGARPKIAAILGSQEMLMSVVSGNLTTICVFIPFLFYIKDLGMMGQMFKGIIFTIVIALVASLLVAVFLVPVLSGKFLPLSNRQEKPVKNKFLKWLYGIFQGSLDWLTKVYSKCLKAALNNRLVTIVVATCILISAIGLIPTMQVNMMPSGENDSVTMTLTMPIGTPLEETKKVLLDFQQYVFDEIKGYEYVTTTAGSSGGRGSTASYKGNIEITIGDGKDADDENAIKKKLRSHFAEYPGATFAFGSGFRQSMMGNDIDIAIRSSDLDAALSVANQVSKVISTISDCAEPSVDTEEGLPQVEVKIDRERAYAFGVDVSSIANEIYYAVDGKTATTYRKDGDDYDVVVKYRPEDAHTLEDLESIYVNGISVANFASVEKGLGPVTISRENRQRIVHVTTDILTTKNANVVEDEIKEGIANSFIIPDNVSVSYEGSWQDTNEQMALYMKIILMAIILVFGVMAATYESFKAPIINMFTIPFMIIGVIYIYKLTGQAISIMSMVGMIMLVGIVVNNGIILVDYTNLLIARGMPLMEACYEAGRSRLRPVLSTTLTTILGMLPMAVTSEGQASLVQPIAVAVLGGLLSSTLVTLLLIPVLYSLIMKKRPKKTKASTEHNEIAPTSLIESKNGNGKKMHSETKMHTEEEK